MESGWRVLGDINDFRGVWGLLLPPVQWTYGVAVIVS